MDVLARCEGVDQRLVAREMRQHAQLDLRVVGRHQPVARRGDEGGADAAPFLAADGDVLQVRIGAREAAGRGRGIDQRRERVDVGRLELRERAVFEDLRRQRVLLGEAREHVHVGREPGLPPAHAARRDAEALEEHGTELGRRVDVELHASERVDLRHQALERRRELGRQHPERRDVDQDAGQLHLGQHLGERHLELVEEPLHRVRPQALLEERAQRVRRARGARGGERGLRAVVAPDAQQLLGERTDAVLGARGVQAV